MTEKNNTWGRSYTTPKTTKIVVHAKAASSGWTIDRMSPKTTSSTKSVKVSYAGMTVIRRNGKKQIP